VRKCGNCGAEVPKDAVYCHNCGTRLPRRSFLKAPIPAILLTSFSLTVFTQASSLTYLLRPGGYKVSDILRSEGFDVTTSWDGYAYVTVAADGILEFSRLEQALKKVDVRWVVLTNKAGGADNERAERLANLVTAVEGVEGAWAHEGVLLVTVGKYSAQQLHTVFRLAGEDVKLYVRFSGE